MLLIYNLGQGGSARVTHILANGLAESGVDVSLVVWRDDGELSGRLDPRIRLITIARGRSSGRGAAMLLSLRKLIQVIRNVRPTVLLSNANHVHVAATLAHRIARLRDTRLVLKMTNPVERSGAHRLVNLCRRIWYRWAFSHARSVLLISEATRAELQRMAPAARDKIRVVDNPYLTGAMLDGISPEGGYEPGRLLAVGRLVPQKNHLLLLQALARLRDLPWSLDLLGDGPLLDTLRSEAERLRISDRIRFRGFVADPAPYYRRAHALLLSSDWEGQGAVLIEALACGCPAVATRSSEAVGAVLQEGRFGRLTPVGDIQAFADAIAAELASRTDVSEARSTLERYGVAASIASHGRALALDASRPEMDHPRRVRRYDPAAFVS